MNYIIKKTDKVISQKRLEGLLKLAEVVQWGRKYPLRFCERFYGIEFLDSQKYTFMSSWTTQFNVWCQSRSSGKTTLLAPFVMAKTNLIPNCQVYIMSGVGSQAQECFLKIEKIAKKEINSFTGLTDVFFNETVKAVSNKDGFTHNPSGYKTKLYNGASIISLNGAPDNLRSKRSNINVYDEAGYAPEAIFEASMPFIALNSDFKLGGNVDISLLPYEFPNQVIMASSASGTDTYFYRAYKDYAKKMFLGDKRYFVCDINADIVMNATFNGEKYAVPLISQEIIDDQMKKNKEKGLREYMNIFSTEGGENQAVKRADVIRNSELRVPILANPDNKEKFILTYDPARSYDNSVSIAGRLYLDETVGYKVDICNGVSFVDVLKKKKTPNRTPEQIDHLKQMLLDYNGTQCADYENIEALLIDSGAGGGGRIISDFLMEDWYDNKGLLHKGLIDKTDKECIESAYDKKYPRAIDKLRLINPKKFKNDLFDALVEMIGLDLITFTETYDMKGFLNLFENTEITYKDNGDIKKEIEQNQKIYKLSFDEELALKNIDLAKEEIVNIYRFDNASGGYRYALSPDKENIMNDDRVYCIAMMAWYLQQKRRSHITNKKKPKTNWNDFIKY